MKKSVAVFSLLLVLALLVVVSAQDESGSDSDDGISDSEGLSESERVDSAYQCLEDKVSGSCSTLSVEEKIFSSLAIGECTDELVSESNGGECWPQGNCDVETTAKALLALESSSSTDLENIKDWLRSREGTPTDIEWFLQVESNEATSCTVSYDESDYNVNIDEDRKISSSAGPCLSPSREDLWFRVSNNCYGTEFSISCDQSFLTNLMYTKSDSPTIYVSEETGSAESGGTTTEEVVSNCLRSGNSCDYEGTLWASLVLDYLGEDVSSYLPYLTTLKEENSEFLPESFLFYLTNSVSYKNELLQKRTQGSWSQSGEEFYDTAVALLGLNYAHAPESEKQETIDFLFDSQGENGCWGNSVRDTGFLLYSTWPDSTITPPPSDSDPSCVDEGYDCISSSSCTGQVLDGYSCAGAVVCCDSPPETTTCEGQGGDICGSDESCVGGNVISADDLNAGEKCCAGSGSECVEQGPPQENTCETQGGGECRLSCDDGLTEDSLYSCTSDGKVCCVEDTSGGVNWVLGIIILVILIALVGLGIYYRDKLRLFLEKIKSKFGKSKGSSSRKGPKRPPGFPPNQGSKMPVRPAPGKFMPHSSQGPPRRGPRPPKPNSKGEVDNVLNKLKDMGK